MFSKLLRVGLAAAFLLANPALSLGPQGVSYSAGPSAASAGLVQRTLVAYAVKKAFIFGGRAFTKKVAQLAADPRTRAEVLREIEDFALKNPKFRQKAGDILQAIEEEISLAARANKVPYNPRATEALMKETLKAGKSNTLPTTSMPNVKMAGKSIQVGKYTVPFDNKGFPIFDKFARYDTRIQNFNPSASRGQHYQAATRALRDDIKSGKFHGNSFNTKQMEAINHGKGQIPEYTWHHHQDFSRMQLVPEAIHGEVRHIGGFSLH